MVRLGEDELRANIFASATHLVVPGLPGSGCGDLPHHAVCNIQGWRAPYPSGVITLCQLGFAFGQLTLRG